MGMRGRQLLLWITPPEEEVLVERVRALVPGLRLIDGGIWPTRTPPLLDRIADATGGRVALWDPGLAGEVECRPTTDGRFRCEAAGYVIWTEPSRVTELGLLGVHVVAGPLTEAQVAFADGVWAAVNSLSSRDVVNTSGERIPGGRITPGAAAWCDASGRFLVEHPNATWVALPTGIWRTSHWGPDGGRPS